MSTLSDKIRILISNKGMTHKQVAEELYVTESAVQKWAAGKNQPTLDKIKDLAQVLDIPVQDLVEDTIEIPEMQEYVEIDSYLPYEIAAKPPEHQDSIHVLFDAGLMHEGILHRFTNAGGVEYSAIYVGHSEIWNCPRENETQMIRRWNELYGDK